MVKIIFPSSPSKLQDHNSFLYNGHKWNIPLQCHIFFCSFETTYVSGLNLKKHTVLILHFFIDGLDFYIICLKQILLYWFGKA